MFDDRTFDFAEQLESLSSLEANMPESDNVYRVEIDASSHISGGLLIKPEGFEPVKEPLPRRKQADDDDDGDDGDEDDDAIDVVSDDDVSSECVVDAWVNT